jgi:CO/xanthine dehydrogenase Mo-binding subunit
VDPIEFRLRHTKDARLVSVLKAVKPSWWQTRPSPKAATGGQIVTGQGVSAMVRTDAYWACAVQVSVNTATGKVTVDKCTVALEPGIVINPVQIKRQVQGGTVMGISHALYEEVRFDESTVTSRDWRTYPIATMADVPELDVVIVPNPGLGRYGGVSEAANALPLSAIAAAIHDATGRPPRRLPFTPANMKALLGGTAGTKA